MTVARHVADDAQAALTFGFGLAFGEPAHVPDDGHRKRIQWPFDHHRSTFLPIFKFERFTRFRSDFASSFRNASRSAFVASNCRRMVSSTVSQRPAMCMRGRFTHWPVAAP